MALQGAGARDTSRGTWTPPDVPELAETIAAALGGRRVGSGWIARCPAHDDRNPSLSIHTGDSGQLLVHCHAGCRQQDVLKSLRSRGLWKRSGACAEGCAGKGKRIVAEYSYTDEAGQVLFQVVRYEPKQFLQRRPDGHGGWVWRKGRRQVLYRLPELLQAPIVFLVEGERDVESLREHGFVATTNPGGAQAPWLDAYTEALRGREVILIPDNDPPGRRRVARIAKALQGTVAKLVILELEGRGVKDVSDWFGQGHSELELIELLDGGPADQ